MGYDWDGSDGLSFGRLGRSIFPTIHVALVTIVIWKNQSPSDILLSFSFISLLKCYPVASDLIWFRHLQPRYISFEGRQNMASWTHLIRFIAEDDGHTYLGQIDSSEFPDIGLASFKGARPCERVQHANSRPPCSIHQAPHSLVRTKSPEDHHPEDCPGWVERLRR